MLYIINQNINETQVASDDIKLTKILLSIWEKYSLYIYLVLFDNGF